MEIITIEYIAKDEDYAIALRNALARLGKGFIVNIFPVSGREIAVGKGDLIVSDVPVEGRKDVIYLTERASETLSDPEKNEFVLYKYVGCEALADSIELAYCSLTGRKLFSMPKQSVDITAFCSDQGGSGCSTLAIAYAGCVCRNYGKRALYMSLEEFSEGGRFFAKAMEKNNFNNYIYYVLSGKHNICSCQENFVLRNASGVETFASVDGRNPLKTLDKSQFAKVLDSILERGKYDEIVLDVGASLSGSSARAVEICNRICMVSQFDRKKRLGYISALEKRVKESGKKVNVTNMYYPLKVYCVDEDGSEIMTIAERPEGIVIDFDRESVAIRDGVEVFSQDGAFGRGVSRLVEELQSKI